MRWRTVCALWMFTCSVEICAYDLSFSLFFFKQKTAYEMRISEWSSDVCSSDLRRRPASGCSACDPVPAHRQSRRDRLPHHPHRPPPRDRKSVVSGKSVSVRVVLGGRRIIKQKKELDSQLVIQVNNVTVSVDIKNYK